MQLNRWGNIGGTLRPSMEVEVGQDAGGNVRVTTTAYDAERRVKRIVTPGGAIHLLATDSAGSVFTCHPTSGPPE